MIQNFSTNKTVAVSVSFDYFKVLDDVYAFKLQRKLSDVSEADAMRLALGSSADIVIERITNEDGINAYLKGESLPPAIALTLADPEFLECVKTKGFNDHEVPWTASNTPFTDLQANPSLVANLVRIDHSAHMVFDPKGRSLPVAVHFSYINARMSNACYDLKKALEILSSNSQIRPVSGDKLEIKDIPYYNSSPNSFQFLDFWWSPTPEQAQQMWEHQLSAGAKYPSTRQYQSIFELDLLGLRAGGAAFFDQFWLSKED